MSDQGDDLRDHAAVVRRLRAMGSQPVDRVVAARHAALMSSVASHGMAPRRRFRPVLVGGLVAGMLFGSVGLAGALTGSVAAPARAVLQTVGLMDDGDDAKEETRKVAPAVEEVDATDVDGSAPEGQVTPGERGVERVPCEDFTGTHGQWVQSQPEDDPATEENERSQAAQDDCGKPVPSTQQAGPARPQDQPGHGPEGGGATPGATDAGGPPTDTGTDDTGRPPHAGSPPGVGTDEAPDGAPGPPSAPGNRPAGAGAGKGVAGP